MARPALLVKLCRHARGISGKEAAAEVGINPTDFSKVENGALRPSARVRQLLETRYGKPWSRLAAPVQPGLMG